MQLDGPTPKRARTHDSSTSDGGSVISVTAESRKPPPRGAAALKPTETAVEQVGKKKKSKYWFYAVEPIAGRVAELEPGPPTSSNGASSSNGHAEIEDGDAQENGEGSVWHNSDMDES
jgi:hypothetical protein